MPILKPASIEIFNHYSSLINKCRKEIITLPWFKGNWWLNVSFGNQGYVFQLSKTHWFNHNGRGIHFEFWLSTAEHQKKTIPFVLHFEPETPDRKALGVKFKSSFSEFEQDFSDYVVNHQAICDKLVKHVKFAKSSPQILHQVPSLNNLLEISEDLQQPKPKDAFVAQYRFFEAMAVLLEEISPAVLVLEDADLLDEASVKLTKFLLQKEKLALLLVLTARDSNESILFRELGEGINEVVLQLPPLSEIMVGTYLQTVLGGPVSKELIKSITERSYGIPLYMEELVEQLKGTGGVDQNKEGFWTFGEIEESGVVAPSMKRLFERRLIKLTVETRRAFALAAMLGTKFRFKDWVTILGGEEHSAHALEILNKGRQLEIIKGVGDGSFSFYPREIAEIFAETFSASRQRELHSQIAEIFREQGEDPLIIARHYQLGGSDENAARFLEQAGRRAMNANALKEAIDYFKRAIELDETCPSQEALGNLFRQLGQAVESINHFERALSLAITDEDLGAQARILNGIAFMKWMHDNYVDAFQTAKSVLDLPEVSPVDRATALSHMGMVGWLTGRLEQAEKWCQQAVQALLQHDNPEQLAGVYNRLGLVWYSMGKFPRAIDMFTKSLDIRVSFGDYWGEAYCLNNLAKVEIEMGEFKAAADHLKQALDNFNSIGSDDGKMVAITNQALILIRMKQPDQAMPLLTSALKLALKIQKLSDYGMGLIYLLIAQAEYQRGAYALGLKAVEEARRYTRGANNQELFAMVIDIESQIYAKQGNIFLARKNIEKAMDILEDIGAKPQLLRTRMNYSKILKTLGEKKEADEYRENTLAAAEQMGLQL